jgi:hypothetical protein
MGLPVSFSANAADEEGRTPFKACGVHGLLHVRRTNPDAFRLFPHASKVMRTLAASSLVAFFYRVLRRRR